MAETFSVGDRVRMKPNTPPLFDTAADRRAAQRIVDAGRVGIVRHIGGGQCLVTFERSLLEWQVSPWQIEPADAQGSTEVKP